MRENVFVLCHQTNVATLTQLPRWGHDNFRSFWLRCSSCAPAIVHAALHPLLACSLRATYRLGSRLLQLLHVVAPPDAASLLTYAASQCSKGALCMQSGCQNWRLSTCNNLCRFGWDFSHDLTAICMEIKVEAATKAHGNVSAAMGFMAPAAASASAQTAAECGRRIWPGLAWRTRNVASRKRKSIRERVAKIKSTKRRRLRCQPTRLLPQTWSRFPRINNTQQIYSKWPLSKSERFSPWVACAQRARTRERESATQPSLQTALPGNRNLRTWLGVAWRW